MKPLHITPEQRRDLLPHVRRYLKATEMVSSHSQELERTEQFIQFEMMRERNLKAIARIAGISDRNTLKLTRTQWQRAVEVVKIIAATEETECA